jgi:regulator of cell morphogenesis and NO signaling
MEPDLARLREENLMTLTTESTVGQWVAQRPSLARVFERHGIDYCCGGKQPLGLACRDHHLDPARVVAELRDFAPCDPVSPDRDWSAAPLLEIVDHIQGTHHAYLGRELPRLDQLTAKVAAAHGSRHPELLELRMVFQAFSDELVAHTNDEDHVLFPLIRSLEGNGIARRSRPIHSEVLRLECQHDDAGEALATMRRLTGDYVPPPDACNTYRALLASLAELEADMHRHVHLENHVLFTRAMAKERELLEAEAVQP